MSNETKKTKTRRKLQKKRQAKEIKKISKPHDKLAKELEDIERKYTKGLLEHRSGDNLSEKQKKALKYKKEVLKSKTPKAFPIKPKTTTKRKIKTDRAKLAAKKIGTKALLKSIPVIGTIAALLESKPAYNKGGTVKNYAKGGGVRKAKFTDN